MGPVSGWKGVRVGVGWDPSDIKHCALSWRRVKRWKLGIAVFGTLGDMGIIGDYCRPPLRLLRGLGRESLPVWLLKPLGSTSCFFLGYS